MTTTKYTFGDYSVSLALDEAAPLGKLDDLHICHLGMKFISSRPLPEFGLYEFDIAIKPMASEEKPVTVKCCGVVVRCEPEGEGFRTVIHFADLAKSDANCLEALTKANHMRCDYCANC
ncbi:MAG TPA: hypothetical protein DCM68_00910 [Verrucomicrobia bacterium]|nr:hypothetical protein [Verrucomicrobiota bacterium]